MDPPRDRIEDEENENKNKNKASLRQSLIVSCFTNLLWLSEIVQEGDNKSNHPIQNPLLLVLEP
jgi:hypothetical protein